MINKTLREKRITTKLSACLMLKRPDGMGLSGLFILSASMSFTLSKLKKPPINVPKISATIVIDLGSKIPVVATPSAAVKAQTGVDFMSISSINAVSISLLLWTLSAFNFT